MATSSATPVRYPLAPDYVPYTDSLKADFIHETKADCKRCEHQFDPPTGHLLIERIGLPKFIGEHRFLRTLEDRAMEHHDHCMLLDIPHFRISLF